VRTAVNDQDVWAEKIDSYEHLGMVQGVQFRVLLNSTLYVHLLPGFLGAFSELRKATISFVTSVRMEQLGSDWTDFHEI
jgi:hypothetical protein